MRALYFATLCLAALVASCQSAPEPKEEKFTPPSVTAIDETSNVAGIVPSDSGQSGSSASAVNSVNKECAPDISAEIGKRRPAVLGKSEIPDFGKNPRGNLDFRSRNSSPDLSGAEQTGSWKKKIFGPSHAQGGKRDDSRKAAGNSAENVDALKPFPEPGAQLSENRDFSAAPSGMERQAGPVAGEPALVSSAGNAAETRENGAFLESLKSKALGNESDSCQELLKETYDKFLKEVEKNPGDDKLKRDAAAVCALLGEIQKARELLAASEASARKPVEDRLAEIQMAFKAGDSENAVEMTRILAEELRAKAPLKVQYLAFAERVDGFGLYTERSSSAFNRGGYMLLYFEIENFADSAAGDKKFSASFKVEYRLLDSSGTVRYEKKDFGDVVHETRTKIRDLNLTLVDQLPGNLGAGEYTLELNVADLNKTYHRKATAKISLTIR